MRAVTCLSRTQVEGQLQYPDLEEFQWSLQFGQVMKNCLFDITKTKWVPSFEPGCTRKLRLATRRMPLHLTNECFLNHCSPPPAHGGVLGFLVSGKQAESDSGFGDVCDGGVATNHVGVVCEFQPA